MNMMQHKATSLLCAVLLTGTLAAPSAYAAIPVIDDSNIMQQAKTYAETMKVVQNTREQIRLQNLDLQKLPSAILNEYKASIMNGLDKIKAIFNQNNSNIKLGTTGFGTGDVPTMDTASFFAKNFPDVIGNDLPETTQSARTARLISIYTLMQNNQNTVTTIQALLNELNSINEEIKAAQTDNANVTGSVQAQQVANHISTLQGKAQTIKLLIQALQGNQQALKTQAEMQEKKNQIAVNEAQGKANVQQIDEWKNKSQRYSKDYLGFEGHTTLFKY